VGREAFQNATISRYFTPLISIDLILSCVLSKLELPSKLHMLPKLCFFLVANFSLQFYRNIS